MTPDQCARKLKTFVERQKPGLLRFFPDYYFDEYKAKGAEMVEKLVSMKCPRGMAEMFAVLVLYDVVILLGR